MQWTLNNLGELNRLKNQYIRIFTIFAAILSSALPVFSQNRYALFLQDEPLATHVVSREALHSAEAAAWRQRLQTAQQSVRNELNRRNIVTTGSVSTLLNAVFVVAPASRVAEMKTIPGVVDVVLLHRREALLNRATTLMNAPQAWTLTPGGQNNAGAGIKVALLDTGVDQTHPALQDSTLPPASNIPKCGGNNDCSFTSNKVIVARSYIPQLSAGSDPSNPALDSRPDDYTPRDHVGHGTATASTVGANFTVAPAVATAGAFTISGMAPKAYIGNYKILGSPTVNDGTFDDIMVLALEDALNDGMDIVSMSVAGPAFTGPLDTGAACGNAAGVPCDVAASAFEAAAQKGLTIVVAAGNSGGNSAIGFNPLFNSINSPSDAPSVITAGASTNSHQFNELVSMTGSAVPANLTGIAAQPSDSFASGGALSGTLVDVIGLGDNGLACSALPQRSLTGEIALIERGSCTFGVKMTNAVNAGAAGVLFYNSSGTAVSPGGLSGFSQTAAMIGNADGLNVKAFIDAHPGYSVTIDPSGQETSSGVSPNQVASFSSFGPSLGLNALKPDILAVGESVYMPSQNYDPLGEMFSSNRYIFAAGTSFATPITAGAAALVKQNHPSYTAAQIKSALVNTATLSSIPSDDQGSAVNILQTGAGLLTTDLAIKSNVTVNPSSVSFGALTAATFNTPQKFVVTNSSTASLSLTVTQSSSGGVVPVLSPTTLAAGATGTFTMTLSGTLPAAGLYSGSVTISGGAVTLHVPWMYLVGQGAACDAFCQNLQVLSGDFDDGTAGQVIPDRQVAFQVTDANGVPVSGIPVSFLPQSGSGITLSQVSSTTDNYGVAYATATLGPIPSGAGSYTIYACVNTATCTVTFYNDANNIAYAFTEYSRTPPAITAAGVVNNAGYQQPIAPGSYISIFGTGMYDFQLTATGASSDVATSTRLPLALDFTMVSFDVPSANPPISVPGRMYFVSSNQIGLQVPWELQGQTSAQVKVTIDFSYGNVVTIPISNYSPAFFPVGTVAAATNAAGVISASNPAVRGDPQGITLYVNGLGPVTNQPATGDPTPLPTSSAGPFSQTTTKPVVLIGNVSVPVLFSGLAPGEVGVYQVNVTLPTAIPAGTQPITISIGGQTSPGLTLPVQ
jgi:minor extracellular serine protease Vpr